MEFDLMDIHKNTKTCNGCKHLVAGKLCKVNYNPTPWVVGDPYLNKTLQLGLRILNQTEYQRAEFGPCGPDAMLYESSVMEKLRGAIKWHIQKWKNCTQK